MTDKDREIAELIGRIAMEEFVCGLTIDGQHVFCDHPKAAEKMEKCACRRIGERAAEYSVTLSPADDGKLRYVVPLAEVAHKPLIEPAPHGAAQRGDGWQLIETAPKDGTIIKAKRIYQGRVIYEGPAQWRTVHFPALPPHPLGGDVYGPAYDATGWMMPAGDMDKRVPEPTHWMPKP